VEHGRTDRFILSGFPKKETLRCLTLIEDRSFLNVLCHAGSKSSLLPRVPELQFSRVFFYKPQDFPLCFKGMVR
jgi:hypothetical protein